VFPSIYLAAMKCLKKEIGYILAGWLADQLTPWIRVLLEKLIFSQLFKKFPAFYGT
jgi:hypothetical protein